MQLRSPPRSHRHGPWSPSCWTCGPLSNATPWPLAMTGSPWCTTLSAMSGRASQPDGLLQSWGPPHCPPFPRHGQLPLRVPSSLICSAWKPLGRLTALVQEWRDSSSSPQPCQPGCSPGLLGLLQAPPLLPHPPHLLSRPHAVVLGCLPSRRAPPPRLWPFLLLARWQPHLPHRVGMPASFPAWALLSDASSGPACGTVLLTTGPKSFCGACSTAAFPAVCTWQPSISGVTATSAQLLHVWPSRLASGHGTASPTSSWCVRSLLQRARGSSSCGWRWLAGRALPWPAPTSCWETAPRLGPRPPQRPGHWLCGPCCGPHGYMQSGPLTIAGTGTPLPRQLWWSTWSVSYGVWCGPASVWPLCLTTPSAACHRAISLPSCAPHAWMPLKLAGLTVECSARSPGLRGAAPSSVCSSPWLSLWRPLSRLLVSVRGPSGLRVSGRILLLEAA